MTPLPLTSTLFPYTTLFRSRNECRVLPRTGRVRSTERQLSAGTRPDRPAWPARTISVESDSDAGRRSLHAARPRRRPALQRSEEHTSELQSLRHLVCRLLLE